MAERHPQDRTLPRRRHLLAALLRGDHRRSSTSRSRWQGDTVALRGRARHHRAVRPAPAAASTTSSLDRLTHWYHTSREWIKKAIIMDGLYVLNNPWACRRTRSTRSYCAMMQLGMPIPETWMVPPKAYEPTPDLEPTLTRYAKLFDLGAIGERDRLPAVHEAVRRRRLARGHAGSTTRRRCARRYEESGKRVMHLQAAVAPVRPLRALHRLRPADALRALRPRRAAARPLHDGDGLHLRRRGGAPARHDAHDQRVLRLGLQLVRVAAQGRRLAPDRLREPVPRLAGHVAALPLPVAGEGVHPLVDLLRGHQAHDAQEPRLGAVLRDRARRDLPVPREARALRARSRDERFETDALRGVLRQAPGAPRRGRVGVLRHRRRRRTRSAQKVAALFPAHEVEQFTELFWQRIQAWRADARAGA